jgi:TatD DNase family protein
MIDAHAHLSDPRLGADMILLADQLKSLGLERVVLGGVDPKEWLFQAKLKKARPTFISPVVGIHPWTVRDHDESELEAMFRTLENSITGADAIGEVGLDFHPKRTTEQLDKQSRWCLRQLELAQRVGLPVVLHVVQGHDVMQSLLKNVSIKGALVHGFRGSSEVAKFYLARGFVLSLGQRSFRGLEYDDYRWLPQSGFVLESDAPPLAKDVSNINAVSHEWLKSLDEAAAFLAAMWSLSKADVWRLAAQNLARMIPEPY